MSVFGCQKRGSKYDFLLLKILGCVFISQISNFWEQGHFLVKRVQVHRIRVDLSWRWKKSFFWSFWGPCASHGAPGGNFSSFPVITSSASLPLEASHNLIQWRPEWRVNSNKKVCETDIFKGHTTLGIKLWSLFSVCDGFYFYNQVAVSVGGVFLPGKKGQTITAPCCVWVKQFCPLFCLWGKSLWTVSERW